jgi:hypothetical protein
MERNVEIVDVDIREMRRAVRRGRSRSPETVALMKAIEELTPGQAKAIVIEAGQTGEKVRARLNYAAKIVERRLQIVVEEKQVLFAPRQVRRRRRSRRS